MFSACGRHGGMPSPIIIVRVQSYSRVRIPVIGTPPNLSTQNLSCHEYSQWRVNQSVCEDRKLAYVPEGHGVMRCLTVLRDQSIHTAPAVVAVLHASYDAFSRLVIVCLLD